MKKFLLFVYFAGIAAYIGYSQSLSLTDTLGNPVANNSSIVVNGTPTDDEMIAYFYVKNNSNVPVPVKVKKVEHSLIDGTMNVFCWGLCFDPSVTVSPDSIVILGNAVNKTDFSGHYLPTLQKGVSVIRYVFFNNDSPNDSVCVNVSFAAFPLGLETAREKTLLSNSYPNPAGNHATFDVNGTGYENATLVIRNILGSVVGEVNVPGASGKIVFNTSELPEGVYFCSLLINGEGKATRKMIVKH